MSAYGGPSIVSSGLVLNLDAGNLKSYPGSGTTWTDLSGNSNAGTLTNGPTFDSANGGSIIFDGSIQYGTGTSGLINNNDFSISFWIYWLSPYSLGSSNRGIISTWNTSWQGFGIGTYNSSIIRSWARDGAGGGMNWGDVSSIANGWHNLVLTYNYSTRTQSGYIDKTFCISEVMSGSTINHSALQISRGGPTGSTQLSSYPYLNAKFSNINIYNRVLSNLEITQNFNAMRGRYGL